MDIPAEDLARAKAVVDELRARLASIVERLPYDADMAVDLAPEDAGA